VLESLSLLELSVKYRFLRRLQKEGKLNPALSGFLFKKKNKTVQGKKALFFNYLV